MGVGTESEAGRGAGAEELVLVPTSGGGARKRTPGFLTRGGNGVGPYGLMQAGDLALGGVAARQVSCLGKGDSR